MTLLRSGWLPGSFAGNFARVSICVGVLMLGGCASRQAQHRAGPQYVVAPQHARVAGYRKVVAPIEIEDDGLEAQTAPPRRLKNEPDNPLEVFSPNYGAMRPDAWAGDAGDISDLGSDAYDPFLDDPQWQSDLGSARPVARAQGAGVAVGVGSVRRRVRPGFRAKRDVASSY